MLWVLDDVAQELPARLMPMQTFVLLLAAVSCSVCLSLYLLY